MKPYTTRFIDKTEGALSHNPWDTNYTQQGQILPFWHNKNVKSTFLFRNIVFCDEITTWGKFKVNSEFRVSGCGGRWQVLSKTMAEKGGKILIYSLLKTSAGLSV